jgi:predicted nucleic acid-binding protein
VYQNGVLKGTVNIAGTKGGTSVIINSNDENTLYLYDLRIYSAALSAAAILYYYEDMNERDGVKTLPTA